MKLGEATHTKARSHNQKNVGVPRTYHSDGPGTLNKYSTTSVLTATILIYALGAGITAAAGTRLALQWIHVKGFKLYSFRLPDL